MDSGTRIVGFNNPKSVDAIDRLSNILGRIDRGLRVIGVNYPEILDAKNRNYPIIGSLKLWFKKLIILDNTLKIRVLKLVYIKIFYYLY